jgi:hypothetical protein
MANSRAARRSHCVRLTWVAVSLPTILAAYRVFPSLTNAKVLRRVVIENLKSLSDFSVFETAPALEEFGLVQGNKQTPEQLIPVLRNPSVRRVCGFFGSDRKNKMFSRLREEHIKADWMYLERSSFSR